MNVRETRSMILPDAAFKGFSTRGLAICNVVIGSGLKVSPQFFHRFPMECDGVGDTHDLSHKNVIPLVKLDTGLVPPVGHYVFHGVTSNCRNHSRNSSAWYFFASLPGWGRRRYCRLPFSSKTIREPLPSRTSPPPLSLAARSAAAIFFLTLC